MKRITIFASGGGSNFRAIAEECKKGNINGKIELLITNSRNIGAVEIASEYNILSRVLPPEGYITYSAYELALKRTLLAIEPDLICLAGYLLKIPASIVGQYPILNIHPALLPKFGGKGMYGHHVHEAVIAAGEKVSGATVHYVNEEYDEGQIIEQVQVPVLPGDDATQLAKRILKEEHILYPRIVKQICNSQ